MKPLVPHWCPFFQINSFRSTSSSPKATDGKDIAMLSCLSPIALSFVICPLAGAQALVHQGEQSHVIGCFPHLSP